MSIILEPRWALYSARAVSWVHMLCFEIVHISDLVHDLGRDEHLVTFGFGPTKVVECLVIEGSSNPPDGEIHFDGYRLRKNGICHDAFSDNRRRISLLR